MAVRDVEGKVGEGRGEGRMGILRDSVLLFCSRDKSMVHLRSACDQDDDLMVVLVQTLSSRIPA